MYADTGVLLIFIGILIEALNVAPTPIRVVIREIRIAGTVGAVLIFLGALILAGAIII